MDQIVIIVLFLNFIICSSMSCHVNFIYVINSKFNFSLLGV